MHHRRTIVVCVLAVAFAGWGCSHSSDAVAPAYPPPPPNSPNNVVRLLEWCWRNRAIAEYSEIFTDDFRFQFALGDSAGNAYRDAPFTREDELRCATRLFVGSGGQPPASEILLDLDRVLVTLPDDRPGRDPKWHKSIRSSVDLQVTIDRGSGPERVGVRGHALFYLVRGDSAAIPPDLAALGFTPDSTRWWIERWEDETLPGGGSRAQPSQNRTWGAVKTLFR